MTTALCLPPPPASTFTLEPRFSPKSIHPVPRYYHQDQLSNRLVTDSSGNTSAQMGHFPFGESWYNASSDKLLFTSYERDSESGNDYAVARYYVSRLARFSSPDPLAGSTDNPQSLNRYSYVLNSPTSLVDPAGMDPCNPILIDARRHRRKQRLLASTFGPYSPDDADATEQDLGDDGCIDDGGGGGGGGTSDPPTGSACDPGMICVTSEAPFPDEPPDDPGTPPDLGMPYFGPNPLAISMGQPAPPVDPIWNALSRLRNLLANDPDCLSFLNSAGTDALGRLATIMDGYYGQAGILPTKNQNGNWTMTNAVSFGYPGQLVTVNSVGAFFAGQIGRITNTTDRGMIPGGTPSAQGFILLHELGHNTNVLADDANNQPAVDANDKKLEKNCSKTIKALSH